MSSLAALLLALCYYPRITLSEEVSGEVKMSFFFESLDGRLPNGHNCDPWPRQKCDIFLRICITTPGEQSCNVHNYQTKIWEDNHMGQTAIAFPLKTPFPKSMDLIVEAWDHDLNSSDLIARYQGNLVVNETPNTPSPFHMVREDFQHLNKFRLESYAHIVCASFHYGGDCSRKCIPDRERYFCDVNGFKKCRPGYLGTECDQRDYCLYHNCSDFAECKNLPTGFECWCDGKFGPQCQLGYNPCAPEHMSCSGHGICTTAGAHNTSFKCDCDVDWEGPRCEIRRPFCMVTNMTNQIICLNEGKCKDLNADTGTYICECPSGWWGQHCEKKTSIIYETVFKTVIYVGLGLFILAILVSSLVFCYKGHQKRKPHSTHVRSTQLSSHQYRGESQSISYETTSSNHRAFDKPPELPCRSPHLKSSPNGIDEHRFIISTFV
ncbi:hypothetical protein Aperf_G00000019786 [Anoplocephala perfoliata]